MFVNAKFWSHITVEPCAALFWLGYQHSSFVYTNLFLQKTCRFNQTQEPDLKTPCDDEKRGIAYVAFVNGYFLFATFMLMTLMSALYVNWSDMAGRKRKFILLLPVFAQIMEMALGCLHSYFWQWSYLSAVLSYDLCEILTGGHVMFLHAATLYMSDTSDKKHRTGTLSKIVGLYFVCIPIGNALSGLVLKSVGFWYSFLIGLILSSAAFILGVIFIKDISVPVEKKESFFKKANPFRIKDAIKTLFQKRPNNKRLVLVLLMISQVMVMFTRRGEKSVLYLYTRHRFHWDEREYSFYDAYKNSGIIVGVLFSTFVFSKMLKMHDITIALFASIWDTAAALGYLFANKNWQLYIIGLFDMFHGAAFIAAKSFTTKIVDASELGNLTSVSALLSFITFLNKPVYNLTFKSYMDTFPNCIFIISVFICAFSCIAFAVSYKLIRNYEKIEEKALEQNPDNSIKLEKSPRRD